MKCLPCCPGNLSWECTREEKYGFIKGCTITCVWHWPQLFAFWAVHPHLDSSGASPLPPDWSGKQPDSLPSGHPSLDVAGFPNVVRRKEFFCANVGYTCYRYSIISKKKKKKRADSPKVIERHRFQARQAHILDIYIHWDLDSKYLGITWKMGNCTFAIDLQF